MYDVYPVAIELLEQILDMDKKQFEKTGVFMTKKAVQHAVYNCKNYHLYTDKTRSQIFRAFTVERLLPEVLSHLSDESQSLPDLINKATNIPKDWKNNIINYICHNYDSLNMRRSFYVRNASYSFYKYSRKNETKQ